MSVLLQGKPAAAALDTDTIRRVNELKARGILPTLAVLRIGERQDDLSYERSILRRAETLGVAVKKHVLPPTVGEGAILSLIRELNEDPSVHGILIMRPLPAPIGEAAICEAIAPEKDVDGVTRASMAAVYAGRGEGFAPCTAEACIAILDHYGTGLSGKRAVVVGRSLVIGRPVAALLTARDATVTLCHSRTAELARVIRGSELVIAAMGRAEYLQKDCFTPGQTVLDVGIHFNEEKQKLVGDVAFEEAASIVDAITPVPGGVGNVTTSVLCRHVVLAAERG
ncbi:MAG: bifunctional 5,10-methylenetetrahydrofolate dehydrogenase/5,10-methenyltetrahydrofolate cyclohydrolase [Oscillospiraceae bacterium]|nr:bifunctional 5,10-methylenetetrahydrofolate dehydrogenase/5,10-methenyltetrahydrofolate cyclohydrolase [Oscillospiraceae bacterium]